MKGSVLLCVLMSLMLLSTCAGCGKSEKDGAAQMKEVPVAGAEAQSGVGNGSGTVEVFPVPVSYDIPERDPFMPLVARESGAAEGIAPSPVDTGAGGGVFLSGNPGEALQPLSPPGGNVTYPGVGGKTGGTETQAAPEMELLSCYREGNVDHAYIAYRGNIYDVAVGQSLDGYMVTAIDPVKVSVSLVKDGETYVLTGKVPVK